MPIHHCSLQPNVPMYISSLESSATIGAARWRRSSGLGAVAQLCRLLAGEALATAALDLCGQVSVAGAKSRAHEPSSAAEVTVQHGGGAVGEGVSDER
eukprot:CAMPEP_0119421544 /NCGR_PEP_ID=MMETSP1335-20130426/26140_1 /TAXON_ID=259385 /ORGANISM="Chrysoculter rhomboideus, Strain RCC1486" /LENGTH=97 /DNA_ID=CAMNT_0007446953 /DNA_START=94 /DNA_END=387 /DNA_ORIENTATION=+